MPNLGSAKCKRDCFNCPYDDCIVDDITTDERKDINHRDVEAYERDNRRKYRRPLEQVRRYKAKRRADPEMHQRDLDQKKVYYQTHKAEILEQQKLYVQANREQVRAKHKAWMQAHPEKAKEYYQRYKAKKEAMKCDTQISNTQTPTMD